MKIVIDWPDEVPTTEVSEQFMRGMASRMALSYFKYGAVAEAFPAKLSAENSLHLRLQAYQRTGNTEFLMDAANFAMIEFMHPQHRDAHFAPTDSDQSPGRVTTSGSTTSSANTTGRENVRLGGSNRVTTGGFYSREGD